MCYVYVAFVCPRLMGLGRIRLAATEFGQGSHSHMQADEIASYLATEFLGKEKCL